MMKIKNSKGSRAAASSLFLGKEGEKENGERIQEKCSR